MRLFLLVPLLSLVCLNHGVLLASEEIQLEDGDVVAFFGRY